MKHILIVLLVAFAVAASANDVNRLHLIYNDEMVGLSKLYADQVQELQSAYLQELNQTAEQFRKLGDLKAYVVQKEVIKKFTEKPSFASKDAREYRKRQDVFDLVRATKVVRLVGTYTSHLEKAKAKLTIANEIAGALMVQKAIDSAKLTSVYTNALKLVEQATAQKAQSVPDNIPLILRPSDAVRFGNHWYKVYTEQLNWNEAKTRCEEIGGHLVTIADEKENAVVAKLIVGLHTRGGYFIGLWKKSDWAWVTNEDASFLQWHPGEPNGASIADAAMLYCRTGTWNDIRSNEKSLRHHGFICEWDK